MSIVDLLSNLVSQFDIIGCCLPIIDRLDTYIGICNPRIGNYRMIIAISSTKYYKGKEVSLYREDSSVFSWYQNCQLEYYSSPRKGFRKLPYICPFIQYKLTRYGYFLVKKRTVLPCRTVWEWVRCCHSYTPNPGTKNLVASRRQLG